MSLDFPTLDSLRQNHPAWRLLASPHAALISSFFQKTFIDNNIRVIGQYELSEALEDELFALRETYGEERFPRSAMDYLNDWATPEKGWLRKFYKQGTDDVQFDLTPAVEKAIGFLESLQQRSFVGTESRLLILFDLLRQLSEGSSEDPQARLAQLKERRDELDEQIARIAAGEVELLDDTAIKDRFMQFTQQSRELLADFREVEFNFRQLDRSVRERIARWEGNKGDLLENIMGEREAISDSEQGVSFRAFWDFLMSAQRQEEFSERLQQVLALPVMQQLNPDRRTRRVYYDWLEAGEFTQRTVARLSQQLRRFLDDQAWLENRRIMEILHDVESKALHLRDVDWDKDIHQQFTQIDLPQAAIEMPMEKPLYKPPVNSRIVSVKLEAGDEDLDTAALYSQVMVDKLVLKQQIRQTLQSRSQISLAQLCEAHPLKLGLAELLAYLEIGEQSRQSFVMQVDESQEQLIRWSLPGDRTDWPMRQARLPLVVFVNDSKRTSK